MSQTQAMYSSARVAATSYNLFLKKETDMTIRENPLLAALKEKGRITNNVKGPEVQWDVRYRTVTVHKNADMKAISANRTNMWKQAKLPFRSKISIESISKFEKLCQGPNNTIVTIADKIYPAQTKAIMDDLAKDLFLDGNSATNQQNEGLHGLNSFTGNTGIEVADNTGGANTFCADPDDTYAGLDTDLGYYGGSWTAGTSKEWPIGQGDYEYKFWSPLLIDVANTSWAASTKTWVNTWQEAMQFAVTYQLALNGRRMDVFILSPEFLRQAASSLDADTQILVRRSAGESLMTRLGFSPLSYEGVDIVPDQWITDGEPGFGLCYKDMELMNMQDQLIKRTDDSDITVSTDVIAADCYCNLKCESPAFFTKFLGVGTNITET
jgi:hypothetical protein